jgi:phage FluMu protein Com
MMGEFDCRKCNTDLENYNLVAYNEIKFCPKCGVKLLKKQREGLRRKVTYEEIDGMIKEHLLEMLQWCEGNDVRADELAARAWEAENCDGVVCYCNYSADRFVMRHNQWVDDALEYAGSYFGDSNYYVKMKAACSDRFLVVAFILATAHFLYDQLGVDRCEGDLTKKRIAEIKRLIKTTSYDMEF